MATEVRNGSATNTDFTVELNDMSSPYISLSEFVAMNNQQMRDYFATLFTIRCPPSLNRQDIVPSILHSLDFEDDTNAHQDTAFCGEKSMPGDLTLYDGSDLSATYLCFAYRASNDELANIKFDGSIDDDTLDVFPITIRIDLRRDNRWHYQCIHIRERLETFSFEFFLVNSFTIRQIQTIGLSYTTRFDTITLRTNLPFGYEDQYRIASMDQGRERDCTFPFEYDGTYYGACINDMNNVPFCRNSMNQTRVCVSSSIEGLRRMQPKYKLKDVSLDITHSPQNQTVEISFIYPNCQEAKLLRIYPSKVSFLRGEIRRFYFI